MKPYNWKEWLITYLPMRVVPVRSKPIAATTVEYKEGNDKEQGRGFEDALYAAEDGSLVAFEEGTAHPCDTKDGYHGTDKDHGEDDD